MNGKDIYIFFSNEKILLVWKMILYHISIETLMFLDNLNIGNIEPILALLGQIPNFVPIIDTEPVSNLQRE